MLFFYGITQFGPNPNPGQLLRMQNWKTIHKDKENVETDQDLELLIVYVLV